jgi:hypothetical protein
MAAASKRMPIAPSPEAFQDAVAPIDMVFDRPGERGVEM